MWPAAQKNVGIFPSTGFLFGALCSLLLPSLTLGQSCISDFEDIYAREAFVTDTTFPRMYIICPRRIYDIGNLDFSGNLIQPTVGQVSPPLPLRSNMTIRCGDQGSRDNLCWLTGGDLHLDGTNILGIKDETLENVRIEGFSFIGAREHSFWATKPGSVTFRDCEFRGFTNSSVPIMLDYFDGSNPSRELVTSFQDCEFRGNRYHGRGAQSALIYGNSVQNRIHVESSLFENNDMVWNNTRPDTHSYIIESLGPVSVTTTCFQDNLVGSSDVVVFGNTLRNDLNYVRNSSGTLCPFSSIFETIEQFDAFTPTCSDASEVACNRYETPNPTTSPSEAPSKSPQPSNFPSVFPTISSQPTITPVPTEEPSVSPSARPTEDGYTKEPSSSPTETPLDFDWPTVMETPPSSSASAFHRMEVVCVFGSMILAISML